MKNIVYRMDNLEYMKTLPDNFYELSIVDPPYGSDSDATKTFTSNSKNKASKRTEYKQFKNTEPTEEYWKELFRISKNQIIWGGNYFKLPCSRYFAIWDKGETMYRRDFAECEYAWIRSGGTRIFKYSPNQLKRIHHTQKPVKLYKWLLKNYAKPGDKILDTHFGSLSIGIACHDYGYSLDAYEIDADYFEAGKKRLDVHRAQLQINYKP